MLIRAFDAIYEEDKVIYGDPDLVAHPQTAARDVDDWLRSVNQAAGPPAVPSVAASASGSSAALPSF